MGSHDGGLGSLFGTLVSLEHLFLVGIMSSLRLLAAFALMPPMGQKFLHGMVRRGIVAILALYIGFGLPHDFVESFTVSNYVVYAGKEVMVGLLLGFVGAQVFWIAESVGALIDNQAGYNNVQMTNPLTGGQSTPVAEFLLHLVCVLFFSVGGMLVFLDAVFVSYRLWPIGAMTPELGGMTDAFVSSQIDAFMNGVVKFAAPVLIILILIELGFGLLNRGASKLEINNLAQPVKGAVTVLMLALMTLTFTPQLKSLMLPSGLMESIASRLSAGR